MKFKLDENLPVDLAEDLRLAGHVADAVVEEELTGAADPVVSAAALRERRIVLTLDKGIANLIQHPALSHAGVVLFRPGMSGRVTVLQFIRSRLPELLARELADHVPVVSERRIRVRFTT